MSDLVTLLLVFAGGIVWFTVSRLIAGYINRDIKHKGKSGDWFGGAVGWEGVAIVVAWPIAMWCAIPYLFAAWASKRIWNRVHMAELVQQELAGGKIKSNGNRTYAFATIYDKSGQALIQTGKMDVGGTYVTTHSGPIIGPLTLEVMVSE